MDKSNMIYNCQSPSNDEEDYSKRSFVMTRAQSKNFTHFRKNNYMQVEDHSQSDL